jgi:hypothetical protein
MRLILLRWIHNFEISAGGIGIGHAETRVVVCGEGFAARPYFPIFAQPEILVDSKIQYVIELQASALQRLPDLLPPSSGAVSLVRRFNAG